ncbi:MAG TPA: cupin domain-containing protein [Devosia sp.]|nr:cupin domain-containing protein [Devosia sp.]
MQEPGEPRIGSKLKHARLLRGYTLRELAATIDCSESMLSKVENDKLRPSISFLHRLAKALGTNIAELFSESSDLEGPVHVFPAEHRMRVTEDLEFGDAGKWFERIVPVDRAGLLQALIHNIPPGSESDGLVSHVGEELGYIIDGELEVIVDGRTYTVSTGDIIFFPSSLSHGYRNTSDRFCRMLKVNTPPSL